MHRVRTVIFRLCHRDALTDTRLFAWLQRDYLGLKENLKKYGYHVVVINDQFGLDGEIDIALQTQINTLPKNNH